MGLSKNPVLQDNRGRYTASLCIYLGIPLRDHAGDCTTPALPRQGTRT